MEGTQVRIRVKKNTILSKKFVKKINGAFEDEKDKKKKKKGKKKDKHSKFYGNKSKGGKKRVDSFWTTKEEVKKKGKKSKAKVKTKKGKKNKDHSNALIVEGLELRPNKNTAEIATELMSLLKKDMKMKVKMTKLVSKLLK